MGVKYEVWSIEYGVWTMDYDHESWTMDAGCRVGQSSVEYLAGNKTMFCYAAPSDGLLSMRSMS